MIQWPTSAHALTCFNQFENYKAISLAEPHQDQQEEFDFCLALPQPKIIQHFVRELEQMNNKIDEEKTLTQNQATPTRQNAQQYATPPNISR